MEKFHTLGMTLKKKEDLEGLYSLISTMENLSLDYIEDFYPHLIDFKFNTISKRNSDIITDVGEYVFESVVDALPDIIHQVDDALYKRFHLETDWLEKFSMEVAYKVSTNRSGDFHENNLGLRIPSKEIIFFDW